MTFDFKRFVDEYATINDLREWARSIVHSRQPDFRIGSETPGGFDAYLERWYVLPRNDAFNVYLHRFLRSDDDRALHDHPWENESWLLDGEYIEHLPDGRALRRVAGERVSRKATDRHRIELVEGEAAPISLFVTGPKIREWGFWCEGERFVHWRDFTAADDRGAIGPGCGEP